MIREFTARISNPWVWRNSKSSATKLREFASAEAASKLDLILASSHTESKERSAMYLRHALDESRHASAFTVAANELDPENTDPHPVDIEGLFESMSEPEFLAFVHLGEKRGRKQFDAYLQYFCARDMTFESQLFKTIINDERMHEAYTWKELVKVVGSEKAARKLVAKMQFWEFRRNFVRTGRFLSELVYKMGMLVLYLLCFPLAILFLFKKQKVSAGWTEEHR